MTLSATEIIDIVNTLKNNASQQRLRQDIVTRLRQHAMTDVPWMPDYLLAAGKSVIMNSPRIAELARQINAVMASYTTTVTATPGDPSLQNKADYLEKAYALRRADLFTPQVVGTARWQQLVVAYGFYKLVCGDPGSDNPWSVLQPDPLSCFFMMGEESKRSMRPSLIGREFQLMARDRYKYGNAREKKMPVYDGKKWDWERLTDEQATDISNWSTMTARSDSVKGQFELLKFYEYDDSHTTYVVGVNADNKGGEILWQRENLTGGSSYVMVPGYMTGSSDLWEKWLPHLWGPMNIQYQIDVINTLRATRSMNIKPQVLVERTPELLQAAIALGITRPTPDGYEALGSDTIIELDGKPHFWELPEDRDLAALEASKQKELEAYISTELSLTSAEFLRNTAVRNIQLALGVRSQQQGLMLTFEAIGEREILKMWASSICYDGKTDSGYGADEWTLTANSNIQHNTGIVKPGTQITVSRKDFEFPHQIEVETASLSEQERQFMVQAALERKMAKISTWPEVLDAAGYQNRAEQQQLLVEEEAYEGASAFYGPWLEPIFRQRLVERAGIMIPAATQPGGQGGAPAGVDNSPNAFPVPETKSVTGASQ